MKHVGPPACEQLTLDAPGARSPQTVDISARGREVAGSRGAVRRGTGEVWCCRRDAPTRVLTRGSRGHGCAHECHADEQEPRRAVHRPCSAPRLGRVNAAPPHPHDRQIICAHPDRHRTRGSIPRPDTTFPKRRSWRSPLPSLSSPISITPADALSASRGPLRSTPQASITAGSFDRSRCLTRSPSSTIPR